MKVTKGAKDGAKAAAAAALLSGNARQFGAPARPVPAAAAPVTPEPPIDAAADKFEPSKSTSGTFKR